MSLRHPSHQSAIELGLMDTEFVDRLKRERERLQKERKELRAIAPRLRTLGTVSRIDVINQRLARIKELLKK